MNEYDKPLAGQMGDPDDPYGVKTPSAGRELDALVAEKIFGWTDVHEHQMWSISEDGRSGEPDGTGWSGIAPNTPKYEWGQPPTSLPYFSTTIAAAWLIVEHLQKTRNLSFVLATNACANGHQNGAKFFEGFRGLGHDIFDCARHEGWSAVDESIPRAICLAALTAAERLEKAAAVKATVDAHAAAPGRADD